jgi:NAD(P)-dependent dehydrogenase (short-subunit alcohol dehydrogenase family)
VAARDFRGKVLVVTGGASGLGRAIALRFAKSGARVVALDRDQAQIDSFASELAALCADSLCMTVDVTDAPACDEAIAAAVARFGNIDVLVNNAGISHRSGFAATKPEVIRRVVEVNFFGAVNCTHAALPHLLASRGVIVAISSVAGFAPLIGRTAYAASKHALHGFFESLRTEVAPAGVDVVMICPSFVATGIDRHALGADGRPVRHAQVVVGERATPEAVADRIFGAASRGEPLVLIGRTAKLAWWVSRLAPRYYERAVAKRLRAEIDDDRSGS